MIKAKLFIQRILILGVLIGAPLAAIHAADTPQYNGPDQTINVCKDIRLDSIGHIFNWASCTLIKSVVPFLFSLATVAFIWGIIQYFLNPDNEEQRKKGKNYMIWGLISLFVMISMWGLVGVLTNTFGIKTLIPQLSQPAK